MGAPSKLSRFPAGGYRELLMITLPLILATLSVNVMLFIDRVLLAQYSLDVMNAVAIAIITLSIFSFGLIALAGIAKVFVAQHHGAGRITQLGEPVWQMIWFSLATSILFIPMSMMTAHWVLPPIYYHQGVAFYRLLCCCMPLVGCICALEEYFVGQGQVKRMLIIVSIANVVNIVLDVVLIFGWGPIPSMGGLGAALATVIAQGLQLIILFVMFIRSQHRFGSVWHGMRFNHQLCRRILQVGRPYALAQMLEYLAWTVMTRIMAGVSEAHLLAMTIGTSIYLLFASISDGYYEGVTVLTAYYVGQNNKQVIHALLRRSLVCVTCLVSIGLLPIVTHPLWVTHLFLQSAVGRHTIINFEYHLRLILIGVAFVILVEASLWTMIGMLEAITDTLYVLFIIGGGAWVFGVLPISYLALHGVLPAVWLWFAIGGYGLINCGAIYWRHQHKFKRLDTTELISLNS